jgi:hypothetical protein
MAQIKVVHDPENRTIMIFFGNPGGEVQSEPFDDSTDLLRNDDGEIIGIMRSDYDTGGAKVEVSVETHHSTQLPDE